MNIKELTEKNLLVIDDEKEITRSLFRQFRRNYTVHIATSGKQALEIMEKNYIQVVLSDQRMPGMTGVDFFSIIKNKYPNALKLILTGYSDIEAVVGAINEGQVFRYLTKPWNQTELNIAIKEAFEKHDLIVNNKHLMKQLYIANEQLENKVQERTKELSEANSRLKNLNIEKNKYIGIVAHDLRNPIGNAFNFSDLLITDYLSLSESDHMKFLKIINDRCRFSLNLIEEFLDASKIESGILDLNFKTWNYSEMIDDCISQNEMFAKKKNQQILKELNNPLQHILCDKNKMEQVLNNLVSNAIKYSPKNTIIQVLIETKQDRLTTRVIDQGPGIPEDEIDSLFQVYHTTSIKPTGGEKSTGLGLSIVKKIVEAHGGEIFVKSKPGEGSEFGFYLPQK